ncbi:apolipoprotein N-acyltransferase [Tessaracoccus palaemonis]|uniref:Apolipoprotein N-acyltransferase n=1 Tax=Tessaracoccus palaemonis TaxID=2829499 RepID=A0ABX8SE15_9ACTN|nr:apolipoprotein N-acyltransferase [Tessaracoccus palaemonis]QXT61647.1 apolipoprotein N-acyltransferase [Tessaracoccus palaemonis]
MPTRPTLNPVLSLAVAVASGLLIGAGQAPMGLWPLTILGVAGLTWLLIDRSPGRAFGLGYLTGAAMNTLTVSWISVLGAAVGVALIAFLALWWGLLGLFISQLLRLRWWPLLVPPAFVAMEYASGKVPFGGFSWSRLGYTAVDTPLSGWYAWIGLAGVSLLVAVLGTTLLYVALDRARWRRGAAVVLTLFVVGGLLNLVPGATPQESVTVAMVQPNVNRNEHGTSSYARSVTNNALSETIFAVATARTQATDIDFVLWPENATDVDPINDAETRSLVETAASLAQVPILVGAVTDGEQEDTRQTTSIWWDPVDGPGSTYHKRDLVPFGEWIPFRDFLLPRLPILKQIGRQSIPGDAPGVVTAPLPGHPNLQIGTIICFELAYDDTSYETVLAGAQLIVSQSNTNTYGGTFQVSQQLTINRVRAMELGREVLASTLNSVSSPIDTHGRVLDPTTEFTSATRFAEVPLRYNVNLSVHVGPAISVGAGLLTLIAFACAVVMGRRRAK